MQGGEVLFPSVWHLVKTNRMVVLSDQFLDPDFPTESGLAFRFDLVFFLLAELINFFHDHTIFLVRHKERALLSLPFIQVFQRLVESDIP